MSTQTEKVVIDGNKIVFDINDIIRDLAGMFAAGLLNATAYTDMWVAISDEHLTQKEEGIA